MTSRSKFLRAPLAKFCLGAISALSASSALAFKVDMYAIGDFVPSSSGGCDGGDRSSWPGMAKAWYDWMGNMGHSKTGNFTNGNMTLARFCDPTFNAGCQDATWVEYPEAAIIATHGFDAGNRWGGLMRAPWNGSCSLSMGGASSSMKVGDSGLRFLHASSCLSLNENYLGGMRQAMQDTATSSQRLHVFTGFHGIMWISSSFNGDYADTAIDGHFQSVAYSWVTNNHRPNQFECAWYDPFNVFGTCQDQCPVAYSIGPTANSALSRINNERYNSGMGSPSSNAYYAWMGYVGCDPVGATPFTP